MADPNVAPGSATSPVTSPAWGPGQQSNAFSPMPPLTLSPVDPNLGAGTAPATPASSVMGGAQQSASFAPISTIGSYTGVTPNNVNIGAGNPASGMSFNKLSFREMPVPNAVPGVDYKP